MTEFTKKLRQHLVMSMFASQEHLYRELHQQRAVAAVIIEDQLSLISRLEKELEELRRPSAEKSESRFQELDNSDH